MTWIIPALAFSIVLIVVCAWFVLVAMLWTVVDDFCVRHGTKLPHYVLSAIAVILFAGYITSVSLRGAPR